MKVEPSKVMVKELNKALVRLSKSDKYTSIERVYYINLSPNDWHLYVNSFESPYDQDFDRNGNLRALTVVYKDDCYAMSKFVSFIDLHNICKEVRQRGRELNFENFFQVFLDVYEV